VTCPLPIAVLSAGTERSSSSFSSSVTGGTKLTYADLGGAGWGMEASHRPTFAAPVAAFHSLSDVNPAASFPPAASAGLQGTSLSRAITGCFAGLDACNLSCDALSNALHSLIKLSSLLSLSRIGTQRSTHGSMNTSYISSLLSYGTVTICPLDLNRICKYILRLNMPVLLMQQILPCIAISATCSCHVASQPHVAAMLPVKIYMGGRYRLQPSWWRLGCSAAHSSQ